MSDNFKHLLMLIFLIVVGVVFYFFSKNDLLFSGHHLRAAKIQEDTERLRKEIIIPLNRLSEVNINTDFLNSPEYTTLKDKSLNLKEPELERPNPFDPVL
jgi:hypothetical protein